jgi:hypothetical protein
MQDNMQIDQWTREIEAITTQVKSIVENIDNEFLNWKPLADQWSVLQVLDHLITVNSSYFPVADQLRSGAYKPPFLGRINFFVNLFGKLILKSVQPEETKKTKTFPIWRPETSQLDADVIDKFVDTQSELIHWIQDNVDLIEQNPVISSPASNNVVYRFQVMLDIIVAHEKRHLLQINGILVQAKEHLAK